MATMLAREGSLILVALLLVLALGLAGALAAAVRGDVPPARAGRRPSAQARRGR
jgi:hypothetical protein